MSTATEQRVNNAFKVGAIVIIGFFGWMGKSYADRILNDLDAAKESVQELQRDVSSIKTSIEDIKDEARDKNASVERDIESLRNQLNQRK